MASGVQKILVAEDDPTLALLLRLQLKSLGYEVDIAPNGAVAVELFEKESFKLVLMDIAMPVLDGLKATAQIRAIEKKEDRHVAIIAVTGQSDRAECIRAGMDDFVQKPLVLEELKILAERYMNR